MPRGIRGSWALTCAALTTCLAAGRGNAQESLPPAPAPVVLGVPTLPPPPPLPPPALTPPPPLSWAAPDARYVAPAYDPLLDGPSGPPGWFAAVEVGLVSAHVKNRLTASVPFPGNRADTVAVPGADLDWTLAPRFEAGYRLPEGLGEFLFSYRFLTTQGHGVVSDFDVFGEGAVKSRLDVNVLDLDYASREWAPAPHWDMKWRVGVRLANTFYDSRGQGLFVGQRVSDRFFGAGPHVGLDLGRNFAIPGLSLFLRTEGALPIGQVRQGFEETFNLGDGTLYGSARTIRHTHALPTLNVQIGLGWTPPGWNGTRFSFGYQYEYWWLLGGTEASHAELSDQGLFLRGEFNF